jgi:hypothetical protein
LFLFRAAKGNVQRTTPAVSYVYWDALVDESVAKKGFTAQLKQRWNPSRCVGSLAQWANVAAAIALLLRVFFHDIG